MNLIHTKDKNKCRGNTDKNKKRNFYKLMPYLNQLVMEIEHSQKILNHTDKIKKENHY